MRAKMNNQKRRIKITTILCLIFSLTLCFREGLLSQENNEDEKHSLEQLLNTKISTASKYEQQVREAPASVTIITSEDIERYGYRTLEDVFIQVAGFYVSYDRQYSYLGVRGFGRPTDYNNRTLLLINDHPLNEKVFGSMPIESELALDLHMVERIEIVRGPNSSLYGTSAMLTVINVITKKAEEIDQGRVAVEIGSFGRLQGSAFFGKRFRNGLDLTLSSQLSDIKGPDLYFNEFDYPDTNNGWAVGLDWEKNFGIHALVEYKDFSLQTLLTSRKKGDPTGSWETNFNDGDYQVKDDHKFVEMRYSPKLDKNKTLKLRGYFDQFIYKGTYPYDILWFEDATNNWFGGEAEFVWDIKPNNRLIAGTEYQRHQRAQYRAWDEEDTYFNDSYPFGIFSLYLQDEYQATKNLSFLVGLRHDSYSDVESSTAPRGAMIYHPSATSTLKFLYGQAYRIPNIFEMYYNDPDSGYKSNPDLKPEKIRTIEIIWGQKLCQHIYGHISLFDFRMNNLIDFVEDPDDEWIQYQNINLVDASGLELGMEMRLGNGVTGYANYTYQDARDPAKHEKLTNSPSHMIKAGFSIPVSKYFFISTQAFFESGRITVHRIKTDPFLLTNLNFSSEPLFGHVKFIFQIRNLFDTEYRYPGGFEHLQDAIVQNGRNFALRIDYLF